MAEAKRIVTTDEVSRMHRTAVKAQERADRTVDVYRDALDGMNVEQLRHLAKVLDRRVGRAHRTRGALLDLLTPLW